LPTFLTVKIAKNIGNKSSLLAQLFVTSIFKTHVSLVFTYINNVKQPQVRAILSKSGYRFCGKGLRQNKRLESISVQFESKMLWRIKAICKTIIASGLVAGMVETYPRWLIANKGE